MWAWSGPAARRALFWSLRSLQTVLWPGQGFGYDASEGHGGVGYPSDLNLVRGFNPLTTARECKLTFHLGSSMDFTWAPFVTPPLAGQTIIHLHIFRLTPLFLAVARGKCLGTDSQAGQHGRSSWRTTHPGQPEPLGPQACWWRGSPRASPKLEAWTVGPPGCCPSPSQNCPPTSGPKGLNPC